MHSLPAPRNVFLILLAAVFARAAAADVTLTVDTPMAAPAWARLQRELLAEQAPACREFYEKHFDARGYLKCFVRWGANDGPDDAFENFNGWPELHALGADDVIRRLYEAGHEGLLRQYTEARTVETPIAREGMYHREFIVQSDWMHHGEGLQLFHRMNLSLGADERYADRARRFAGFYLGTDPAAPNYDPSLRLIRSMLNGSRGPMLRPATALDWVGDPFDVSRFVALHGEKTYAQFLQHYEEYTDVDGDHFLNLVATTLPTVAYLVANEPRYREWLTAYMDAWLERMRRNGGVIPSHIDPRDGSIGGPYALAFVEIAFHVSDCHSAKTASRNRRHVQRCGVYGQRVGFVSVSGSDHRCFVDRATDHIGNLDPCGVCARGGLCQRDHVTYRVANTGWDEPRNGTNEAS